MGKSRLKLGEVEYFIKPLSLDDFDQAAKQVFARSEITTCEVFFGVSTEYLQIPGAIEPPLDDAPQEHWPALIEEFKRINPHSVFLTTKTTGLDRETVGHAASENGLTP